MNRPQVLITRRIAPLVSPALWQQLEQQATLITNPTDAVWSPSTLQARAAPCHALISCITEKIDASLLAAAPYLAFIANVAVGYNNIDIAACQARGIQVSNTPNVLTEATADHAWALLLAAARRLTEADRFIRRGQWQPSQPWALDMFLGADIHHRTLGIYGMGRIGAAIAQRAQGFAMRVQYHNRQPSKHAPVGVEYVSREKLLAHSDFVVVAVPYTRESHHLLGHAEFLQMPRHAVLVNIARGGVIDDAALAHALQTQQIAAAGLDVFEGEPTINPDLVALENVVLTPHIGSATRTARQAMAELAIHNVLDWLAGQTPRTVVIHQA
ncbi:2-hydroxyacid dehydrogenase [Parvibium lacunae]|uniref:D-glycerate dehydrogenase n=1 Tax=Parvibium lacunae TaxID=1888893 RepID=A0A368KZW9_9BURK|nr:D-glycerate dehydrogenase [Parvibium lacunae]RCS56843.1 D-glycerate dehydrogenase [Parvibium lacunae]